MGLNEFFSAFIKPNNPRLVELNTNRYLEFFLTKLFRFLLLLRIIGKVSERSTQDSYEIIRTRGILYNIAWAGDIYFQNKIFLNKIQNKYSILEQHKKKANDWLESHNLSNETFNLIFIHIRRGDYLFVPSIENPAAVTLKWIDSMIDNFNEELNNTKYIVMGDDKMYLEDFFEGKESVIVSKNSQYVDLALMSECKYGVLSASSYSLMGACVSKASTEKYKFIAPRYWMGNKVGTWIPNGIEVDWLNYFDVFNDKSIIRE